MARRRVNGPLAIKGVTTPEDARRSISSGATGVMVSITAAASSTAPALVDQIAAIREAVGAEPDVICDRGARRGSDVVKALSSGATACSAGHPYLYELTAGGEAGVNRALTILYEEFVRSLVLAGILDICSIRRCQTRRR